MGILSEKINGEIISVEIESTNLKFAEYNTNTKVLSITFKNDYIYDYYDVSWEIFTKLRTSESQGKFFNTNISKQFNYKKREKEI